MKSIILPCLVAGVLTYSINSHSQESESSETTHRTAVQLNEDGMRYFQSNNYRRAIESFTEAYSVNPDSNLLFNIARCYEKLGDFDAAREKYKIFLDNPGADAAGRLKAKEALDNIEKLQKENQKPLDMDPIEAYLFSSNDPIPPVSPGQDHAAPIRWIPWTGLGLGVLSTTVGAILYSSGANDHDKVISSKGTGDQSNVLSISRSKANDLVHSGDTKKMQGVLGIGIGVALITVSGSFLIFSGSSSDVALQVNPDTLGANLNITGSF